MQVDKKTKMAIAAATSYTNRINLLIGFLLGLGFGVIGATRSIILLVILVGLAAVLFGFNVSKKSELNTMLDQPDQPND